MEIIGLGTDIVEIQRIRNVLDSHGKHFTERTFTQAERAAAESRKESVTFYAGRWAAKEAAAKALGCGIGKDCALNEIEIINTPCGAPAMTFSGNAEKFAAEAGVKDIKISISHETNYAVATVILCG